jgi:rhamnosyltransferase
VNASDKPESENPLPIDSSISSGSLYRVAALQEIGGFREEYFIDFVDHECHLRLRRAGWSIWWDRESTLYHKLGKLQKMTKEGLWIEHAPFRYYYMARNMTEGYWRLGGLRALVNIEIEIFRHIGRLRRFGQDPNRCTYYIFRGLKDAFLGKSGPLNAGR